MARKQQQLESFHCSISMSNAAVAYKHIQKLMGVSKASYGKEFAEWTPSDRKLWHGKFQKQMLPFLGVSIRYMPSEECFFVCPSAETTNSYLADLKHKGMIYSQRILEQPTENQDNEYIDARIYARAIKGLGWCLTVALYWNNGIWFDAKQDDFKILCDFPVLAAQNYGKEVRDNMKQLGFMVGWHEPLQGAEDEFGDYEYYPDSLDYEKNGVQFYVL